MVAVEGSDIVVEVVVVVVVVVDFSEMTGIVYLMHLSMTSLGNYW